MSIHSPACWYALAEFRCQPTDSVQYGIAHYIEDHDADEGLDLLLAYVLEGSHSVGALDVARKLVHVLAAEAFDSLCSSRALTAAPTAVAR